MHEGNEAGIQNAGWGYVGYKKVQASLKHKFKSTFPYIYRKILRYTSVKIQFIKFKHI
jgi:hypothetical protein